MEIKHEYAHSEQIRKFKDKLLKPVVEVLSKAGIKANYLTLLGVLLILPIFFFYSLGPLFVASMLFLKLVLDILDGSLARHEGAKAEGKFYDLLSDHLFVWLFAIVIYQLEGIGGVYVLLFLLSYALMFMFKLLANLSGDQAPFPFVKIYILPILYLVFVTSNVDIFNVYYLADTIFMIIMGYYFFKNIKWSKFS